jgi:hypothetical protein
MVIFDTSSFSGISTKVSGLSRHLPTTCVNMFLDTGNVLRKKGSRRLTKRSAENIEEVE